MIEKAVPDAPADQGKFKYAYPVLGIAFATWLLLGHRNHVGPARR